MLSAINLYYEYAKLVMACYTDFSSFSRTAVKAALINEGDFVESLANDLVGLDQNQNPILNKGRAGPIHLNNHTRSDKWISAGWVKLPWAEAAS